MKSDTRKVIWGQLVVSGLFLSACGMLPPGLDSDQIIQQETQRVNEEFRDSSFESLWSPDGKQVAIRMISPKYLLPSHPLATPERSMASGSDTVVVYDAASGEIVNSWFLATPPTQAPTQLAFYNPPPSQMQWSADGRHVMILQQNREQGLLQSLSMYKLDVSRQRDYQSQSGSDSLAVARAIYIPAELKTLATLRFESPSLSRDGEHIALYRVLQRNASESYELIDLDMATATTRHFGQLDARPVQGPSWGVGAERLYVMTESTDKGLPLTHLWRYGSERPELKLSVQAKQGIYQLSPDGSLLLASFSSEDANLGPVETVLPHAFEQLNLVQNLETGERTVFQASFTAHQSDNGGQQLWDSLNRLNFSSDGTERPRKTARDNQFLAFDPASRTSVNSVEITQPLAELSRQLKPQFAVEKVDISTLQNDLADLSAIAPKGHSLLLRLNHLDSPALKSMPMFYVWNPDTKGLVNLRTSFDELRCGCKLTIPLDRYTFDIPRS